jgi:RNase P subunit RPR2
MNKDRNMICHKCRIPLTYGKTEFHYLGHSFSADVLRCAKCGQVFIPEETAKGRMNEVEMMFESK